MRKRCFDENICVFMSLNVCFDMKTFAFAGFDEKNWCVLEFALEYIQDWTSTITFFKKKNSSDN